MVISDPRHDTRHRRAYYVCNHENNLSSLPVITTIALWQLMHLGTWCTLVFMIAYIYNSIAIESWSEWNLNHDHWIPFRCMYYPEKQFTFLNFFHEVSLKCLRITFRSTSSSSKLSAKIDASSGRSSSKLLRYSE